MHERVPWDCCHWRADQQQAKLGTEAQRPRRCHGESRRIHGKTWIRRRESYCPGAADWAARCSGTVRERRLIRPCAKGVPLPCSDFIFPWMHLQAPWSVKAWYTGRSPAHIRCQAEGWCDQYNEPLYRAWRTLGHAVVARAHRWQPSMRTRAKRAWQAFNPPPTRRPVLGDQGRLAAALCAGGAAASCGRAGRRGCG